MILNEARRLGPAFFERDVLEVASGLLGQHMVIQKPKGERLTFIISETEAYRGEEDLACHARAGLTARTAPMYEKGGALYLYFIYGMYWMLNVVTGIKDQPQAVLIRGLLPIMEEGGPEFRSDRLDGPGKLTRALDLDGSYRNDRLCTSSRIWVEDTAATPAYSTLPRVGIDYAPEPWRSKPWRFIISRPTP